MVITRFIAGMLGAGVAFLLTGWIGNVAAQYAWTSGRTTNPVPLAYGIVGVLWLLVAAGYPAVRRQDHSAARGFAVALVIGMIGYGLCYYASSKIAELAI